MHDCEPKHRRGKDGEGASPKRVNVPSAGRSPDRDGLAASDCPGCEALADCDRHVGRGLSHVAVVVIHRLGLAGFESQVPQ